MTHKLDAVIVGAGPTGLMMASLLARCGVNFRIFDRNKRQTNESRAFAIQARSLELFQNIGLIDEILKRGSIALNFQFILNGKLIANVDLDDIGQNDTPFPFVFILPQAELEKILVEDLKKWGVQVEQEVEVTSLTETTKTKDEVHIRASDSRGTSHRLAASYIIGADGAHSIIRRSLGIDFEGEPYPQNFLLADCEVDWQWDCERPKFFIQGQSFALYFPLNYKNKGFGRVIVVQPSISTRPDIQPDIQRNTTKAERKMTTSQKVSLEEVQRALRQVSDSKLNLSNPVWISRYRVHHRLAKQYRVNRVFLAGDAAHIHSPAGGQGLNTGLQDAANLAWKLVLAIRKHGPKELLDTYESERRPIGKKLLVTTDRLFGMVSTSSRWRSWIRNTVFSFLPYFLSRSLRAKTRVFHFISQLGIRYHTNNFLLGKHAGERAPNAKITNNLDVFKLLQGYRFHLLVLSRKPLSRSEINSTTKELSHLPLDIGMPLKIHFIGRRLSEHNSKMIDAITTEIFYRYGLTDPDGMGLVLIRPDGYIAFQTSGLRFEELRKFLSRFSSQKAIHKTAA